MNAAAKKRLATILSVALVASPALALASCAGGGGAPQQRAKSPMEEAAGTYKGIYFKCVGDPDEARVTNEPFTLELKGDGTGTHHRDDLDIDVTWKLDGEAFTMTETFMGMTIDYTGTLKGESLDIFNGDPKDEFTYEYVYTSGELPKEEGYDYLKDFTANYTAEQAAAMSTNMACGFYAFDGGKLYGSYWNAETGDPALVAMDFTYADGNVSVANKQVLDTGLTPNYLAISDGYLYYLAVPFGGGAATVKRVALAGGTPEVLVNEDCDYLSLRGDRLYFKDGSGHFCSCALDGTDKKAILAKEVAWPYLVDDNWVVYQDVADGATLHLYSMKDEYDARLSAAAEASAPVIDGHYLYFTAAEGSIRVLHRLDLSSYDEQARGFAEQAGTKDVGTVVLFGDAVYPQQTGLGDAPSVAREQWDQLEVPAYDPAAKGYRVIYHLDANFEIQWDIKPDNSASVYVRAIGSDMSFGI